MFGDTTLNCWSISDRARKLGNEMNRWKFCWRAVITVWIVRNRCKFPEKVQLVSPTSYLLRYFRNNANVESNARFAEWRQNPNFYVAWKLFHITPMHFQSENFRKGDKSKSCGSARKLTNIMYIFKTPTTQTLSPSDWQYIWVSQTHIQSFTHQDVDFQAKAYHLEVAEEQRKLSDQISSVKIVSWQKTRLVQKEGTMAQKAKNKGKSKVAEIPDHLK